MRLEHLRARLGRRKLGRGLEETVAQSRLDQGEEEGVRGGSRWSETSRDGERLGHSSGTQRARTRVQGSEVLWSLYLERSLERSVGCSEWLKRRDELAREIHHQRQHHSDLPQRGAKVARRRQKRDLKNDWPVYSGLTRFNSLNQLEFGISYI